MIAGRVFCRRPGFGKYLFDHPELQERLADGAFVYFEVAGEADFNQYSRELADARQRQHGTPVVLVRVKRLAPPQGSRLIDPVVNPVSAVA